VSRRGEHPKKLGTPYVFLQPLRLATSNLVHNLGLGVARQKQRLGPKLAGVWTRGAHKKIWDPLRISATVEASNFKFGTQIWFETSLPKRCLGPKLAGVLARGASKKVGTLLISATLKLATSNLVYYLGLGLSYQKSNV